MKTQTDSPQLYELTRAIPKKYIKQVASGGGGKADYIPHYVIEQVILATVGHFDWELVEILRADIPPIMQDNKVDVKWPPLMDAIVGCVYRMTVTVDGEVVTITEPGSIDAGAWENNDGERLKKASSDALKRCAMRLGIGLHLWCKTRDEFFLPTVLRAGEETTDEEDAVVGVEEQEHEQ